MADLSVFATQEKSDEGVWFPVKLYGQKIPIALLIYGDDSDVVQKYNRDRLRKMKINSNGNTEMNEEMIEELLDSADDAVVVRIGGISSYDWKKGENINEPIELNGKTIQSDKRSIKYLIEQIPAIKQFVNEKSNERQNFLASGKKN